MTVVARTAIALIGGYVGWLVGQFVAKKTPVDDDYLLWIGFLSGALIGYLIAPPVGRAVDRVSTAIENGVGGLSAYEALSGAVGLLIGLILAYSVRGAYEDLGLRIRYGPEPFYVLWPPMVAFFAYVGVRVGRRQRSRGAAQVAAEKLLDTSVIIDGRIVDVVQSGFIDGSLILPRFVLAELQLLADSADATRRARGKRGLEVLERLRAASRDFRVVDHQAEDADVDAKLVTLARRRSAKIITNDYNLNRVAKLQGVEVLNINELSNAVKAVALPGEAMAVSIVKDGKEQNQGVGFLDDGTMVVVENGRERKGEHVGVEVTSVLQTAAGRMIFAKLKRSARHLRYRSRGRGRPRHAAGPAQAAPRPVREAGAGLVHRDAGSIAKHQ